MIETLSRAFAYPWVYIPITVLFSIALFAKEDFTNRRMPDAGSIKSAVILAVILGIPAYALIAFCVFFLKWQLAPGIALAGFYGFALYRIAATYRSFARWIKPFRRLASGFANLFRPGWNKRAFENVPEHRYVEGIVRDENRERNTRVIAKNIKALDGLKDRGLLRAAKHARDSEVAREAVKRLSDKDLALQFPAILDSRREIPLALLNAKTLAEAAAKTDNPAWLLRLLAHARTDREIDAILDRPEVVARIAVLASEACFPVEVLERIIARFPDQLQSESIPPERAARLNEKTMLAIARKGATDAWLQKTAAAWSGDKDAWLALARLVHDADWLVEQAADINRSWYAPEILGGLEAKDIAARTKHILERLPFRAVESIVEKLGPCPACGGKIEIERRGWTHTAGGPADSFYRESVSYEATTTSESIRCASCRKVFAEESHTG